MAKAVGKIFAELDLDKTKYEAGLASTKKKGKRTATEIEQAWKVMGKKSDQTYDEMKGHILRHYNTIKNHASSTAADIVRAEKAKNAKITRLNEQQFGEHRSFFSRLKQGWQSYAVVAIAAIYSIHRVMGVTRREFGGFETSLVDMGKVTDRELGLIRKDIMAINPVLGDATALMKGYYQVISAGVTNPTKALDLLTTAAKTAKAAHVDQAEVIKALTKVMAGFGGQIKSTADAADLLFTTEKLGQTTVAELVPIIGDIAKASKEAGVNQYEMAAALSLITQTAGSTADAATQYRGILIGLLRPNEELTKLIRAYGYETGVAMVKQIGFANTLRLIRERASETGVQIGKLFRSSEGMLGLASLSAGNFENYKNLIVKVGEGAGSADKAFGSWLKSAGAVDDELSANFKRLMIEIGTKLAPQWNEAIKELSQTFFNLAENIKKVDRLPSPGAWIRKMTPWMMWKPEPVAPAQYRGKINWPSLTTPTPPAPTPTTTTPQLIDTEYQKMVERANKFAIEQELKMADERETIYTSFYTKQEEEFRKFAKTEETMNRRRLEIYQNVAGGIANTFLQIAQAGGEQSKKAFAVYQAFAIAQAYISGALAYAKTLAEPALPFPGNVVMANIIAGMTAVQIAMIASAKPPSYDEGGISRARGVYQTGNIDEAHIPLKGGKVPVNVSGGGQTVQVILNNPTFQDAATQRRVFAQIAEVIVKKTAVGVIRQNYNNDGDMRQMTRSRA